MKPVIKKLKQTLVGTGVLLVTAVFLFIFATPVEDFFQTTFGTKENTSDILSSKISKKANLRYKYTFQTVPSKVHLIFFYFVLEQFLLNLVEKRNCLSCPLR